MAARYLDRRMGRRRHARAVESSTFRTPAADRDARIDLAAATRADDDVAALASNARVLDRLVKSVPQPARVR
jgi:hypothetical protein